MPKFDPVIEKISDYVQSFQAQESSLIEAKNCFFDSIACAFMALDHEQVKKFIQIEYIKNSSGSVRVIGTNIKTNAVDAAFLNGALIRWLDFNDTWLAKEWGHPSDNISIVLALTDYLKKHKDINLSFKEILNFMVLAHEVQGALAIENSLNREGLDHVALVKVASAAVGAKMMGLDSSQIKSVISNAFLDGQSLRTYRHFPNTGARKSWAAGDASAKALKQIFISEVSDESYPTALTSKVWGFNDVLMGNNPLKLERNLESYVMDNILYKVSFPAEFHAQTAAEAAISISKKLEGKIGEIKEILISTQEPGVRIISKQGPLTNYADRDHCIEYIVAWCLINGNLDSNSYSDESAMDKNIDVLRNLTTTIEDKTYTEKYYDLSERAIPNKVIVKLKSGETYEEEVLYPLGHRKRRDESKPFLRQKFCKSIENKDFDTAKLISFYDENDLDSINIYDLLDNIYK
jgi:2-methylcitrate dehydratase